MVSWWLLNGRMLADSWLCGIVMASCFFYSWSRGGCFDSLLILGHVVAALLDSWLCGGWHGHLVAA
jgi:hypothetical protein